MKPSFHPQLVNGPCGDPTLYIEFLFEKRAMLFDLGDISRLAGRKILRISHIFVSHTHVDHFIGFDHFLRVMTGRDKRVALYGPPGFVEQVGHKLASYTWNLVENYTADLHLRVTEVHGDGMARRALFRCRNGFQREDQPPLPLTDHTLLDEETLKIRYAVLDHKIPCLAFSLEEKQHVNVWKNRLDERGLATGPWLRELKRAVLRDAPDDTPVPITPRDGGPAQTLTLGELKRDILRVVAGQKITYVVDTAYHPDNAARIIGLARNTDLLYIGAPFAEADAAHAAARHHLTARQAGTLGRMAGAQRLIPFHFSARYSDARTRLQEEAENAFHETPRPA